MARPPRLELAGSVYHVWARGAVKQIIFPETDDWQRYRRSLAQVVRFMRWQCLGYCLMSNHVHLVIETPLPNLWKGMHRLHGAYAQSFNRLHGKTGHVFERRYDAKRIENDGHLLVTLRYVARNAVAAGLCRTIDEWPWSSHAAIAQGIHDPCLDVSRLYSYFSSVGGDPRERYLEFVSAEL